MLDLELSVVDLGCRLSANVLPIKALSSYLFSAEKVPCWIDDSMNQQPVTKEMEDPMSHKCKPLPRNKKEKWQKFKKFFPHLFLLVLSFAAFISSVRAYKNSSANLKVQKARLAKLKARRAEVKAYFAELKARRAKVKAEHLAWCDSIYHQDVWCPKRGEVKIPPEVLAKQKAKYLAWCDSIYHRAVDCPKHGKVKLPPGIEVCDDKIDNNGDGKVDCEDSECASLPLCIHELFCDDKIDNDGDGKVDCEDSECAADPLCLPK